MKLHDDCHGAMSPPHTLQDCSHFTVFVISGFNMPESCSGLSFFGNSGILN